MKRSHATFASVAALCAFAGAADAVVVYQTVQPTSPQSANYHTFITQVTGNGSQNFGDEVRLDVDTTERTLTSIVVPTQTFQNAATPAYQPAFIELRLWANNGAPSADGTAPDGNPNPGALPFAVSRVPGPAYPAGGNHGSVTNFQGIPVTFNFAPTSVYNAPLGGGVYAGDAPFANNLVLPEEFTVTIVNLNAAGEQDGNNVLGNQWGPYLSTGSTSNVDPDANPATDNNNTTFNTNEWGTSRTGAPPYSFSNSGHWVWNQGNGAAPGTGWADSRTSNVVMSMTINAIPEPAGLSLLALAGFGLLRRRPRCL